MITSASIYHVLHFLNITIDIRNVCVFLAPFFSSLTTLVTFQLTKELKVIIYTAEHFMAGCLTTVASPDRFYCMIIFYLQDVVALSVVR